MAVANIGDCGYWMYSGSSEVPTEPRVFTRAEKGQALTHLEMDFNLASLLHKLNTSSAGDSYSPSEESSSVDVYFERHKPTRAEEMAGLFATFSYAPVMNGTQSVVQIPQQVIKIQHTTDEIRYKLSNEQIPGTLDIQEDFRVTGSAYFLGNLNVKKDTNTKTLNVQSESVLNTLRVTSTASVGGDLYISGNLYVNGVMFGNLSQSAYNSLENPNYASEYLRWGVQDTGSQSDARLKLEPVPIYDALDKVESIRGYEFDWAPEAEKEGHDVGLIAQEVEAILPEAVAVGRDGYLRLDYVKVVPLLVQAIKELKWEVDKLKEKA